MISMQNMQQLHDIVCGGPHFHGKKNVVICCFEPINLCKGHRPAQESHSGNSEHDKKSEIIIASDGEWLQWINT